MANAYLALVSPVADAGVAHFLDTAVAYTSGKLQSWRANGSEKASVDFEGSFTGKNGTLSGNLAVTGNFTVETDLFQVVTGDGRIYVNDGGGTPPSFDGATVAAFINNAATGRECRLSIIGGTAGESSIVFGDADDEDQGRFKYVHGDDSFVWETGGSATDCMTLDGSCNLTVGGTLLVSGLATSNPGVAGAFWNDSGTVKISSG